MSAGATAIIPIHAVVALLFCGIVLSIPRDGSLAVPRWLLMTAAVITALWALATAGIGRDDPATGLVDAARDASWLAVLAVLDGVSAARRGAEGRARLTAYGVTAACFLLSAGTAVAGQLAATPAVTALVESTALTLRMLAIVAALVLVQRAAATVADDGNGRRAIIVALGLVWAGDAIVYGLAWIGDGFPAILTVTRGAVMAVAAPPILVAIHRAGAPVRVSRSVTLKAAAVVGVGLYVLISTVAMSYLGTLAGSHAPIAQTAFVFGTAASLLTLASTPWLRGWAKVFVAKHLFRHRYDYRSEWMRFTATLGAPDGRPAPLAERIVQAVADMTASPAGLLLMANGEGLAVAATWRCDAPDTLAGDAGALLAHLAGSARIVDLDQVRDGVAPATESAAIPEWLLARDDAWALVPLLHGERLIGVIVLTRPPIPRPLDWEDFDLLGAAGRQAASYLAEEAAHDALVEAQRFEEFNRRFAFIMHDLKNLVSQMALVARNAERHADNPDFRADMVATLQDTSQRMTLLLSRLSQRVVGAPAVAARGSVAVLALAERMADARRAQHPIHAGGAEAWAVADASALETILDHVIQNAVEASAPGVPVTLLVGARGNDVTIEVTDRGHGMTPAFIRDGLFRPFVSRKPTGFGLGAFEARQLVEAMGGRLEVESREGVGTCFRIALPRCAAVEAAA